MDSPPQKRVNFNDYNDSYSTYTPPKYDPYDSNFQSSKTDAASIAPSNGTSGFLAHDTPARPTTFVEPDTRDIGNSYKLEPSIHSQSDGLDRRTSDAGMLRPSGKDPLSDTDDGYSYSDRAKGYRADDDDSLVHNAADMGRLDKPRGMSDLGMQRLIAYF